MTGKSVLVAVVFAAACRSPAACDGLSAEQGWIRQPPPGQEVAAGYVVLLNGGTSAVRITGVDSPAFESATLHETIHVDGQARMRRLDAVDLAPGDRFVARPGGPHIMLHGPAFALETGVEVGITIECATGPGLDIELRSSRTAPE